MSNQKNDSGHLPPAGFLIGVTAAASACTGIILVPFALDELFRYSPYADPGAGTAGLWLSIAAAVLILTPLTGLIIFALARSLRRYLRWRRSLTPAQRAAVTVAEIVIMTSAGEGLRHHNREESARLTRSVMGPEREGTE